MRPLIAHLAGDYVLQSDWMAKRKTVSWTPALLHGLTYTLAFLPLTRDIRRLAVIGGTHLLIDHYRPLFPLLAARDQALSPRGWANPEPPFWLHIVVDNALHLLINEIALSW